MGLLDKIKNALFEVEYVEVEESPKNEKKVQEEKPVAKKIVLPGKKEEKVEEIHEEELKDEDFEIRPKDEMKRPRTREEFKIMNDNDFKVEEDYDIAKPEIVQVLDENTSINEEKEEPVIEEPVVEEYHNSYDSTESSYEIPYTPSYPESKPYGVDNSYNVPVHEYGTYEKKEEKTYFRPSPIISPIYGILDKNYKKEDVKEKRDIRISYGRNNASVDDIRNKAYGEKNEVEEPIVEEETKFEVEEEKGDTLVDLSDRAKPEVKEITMGDAVEYFQDLGLEYNVDYLDVSKEKKAPKKTVKEEKKEDLDITKDLEDTMNLNVK